MIDNLNSRRRALPMQCRGEHRLPSDVTAVAFRRRRSSTLLRVVVDMFFNVAHLLRPAPRVHAKRQIAPFRRQRIESGFGQDQ